MEEFGPSCQVFPLHWISASSLIFICLLPPSVFIRLWMLLDRSYPGVLFTHNITSRKFFDVYDPYDVIYWEASRITDRRI